MSAEPAKGGPVRNPYIVGPVERALQVLTIVGRSADGMSLAELANETEMPKSTVFRYLRTFLDADFIDHDATADRYHLGYAVWRLSHQSGEHHFLQQIVVPAMTELVARYDETVNFGVVNGAHVQYLEIIESSHSLRMQATLGARDPLHSTALGKALLAAMPGETWREVLPARLRAMTRTTVRTRDQLAAEITWVRESGYAIERSQNEDGALCVASAIVALDGAALGAISLSAPVVRMTPALEAEVGVAIHAAAATCSGALSRRKATHSTQTESHKQ